MVSFSGLENEHSDLCEKKKPAMVSYVGWLLQEVVAVWAIRKMLEDKARRVSTIERPGESQASDGKKQSWVSRVGNIWVVVWVTEICHMARLIGSSPRWLLSLAEEAGASSEIGKSSRTSGFI
jgi:hypothetical protein